MGLYPHVEKFVRRRIKELEIPATYQASKPALVKQPEGPIRVKNCSASFSSPLIRTRATRRIQESFGVNKDMLTTTLFSELSFEIKPGEIALLCGPSGAGKTTLLRLLFNVVGQRTFDNVQLAGEICTPPGNPSAAMLQPLRDRRPLVNSLGTRSLEDALFALNVSGLAEPHLYVKRFSDLSNGQRYRAMVAKLIASGASFWFADEFCATLDPVTSNIVCRNLRRCAKRLGATAVLAAASWSCFIDELRPDIVIHLRSPWDAKAFSWPEFKRAIRDSDTFRTV